nr:nose resistant to fluoxetine protein 6-like [Biomphalaria glabrata]
MNYRKCGSLLTLSLLLNALVLSETEDSARAPDSSPMINILNKILNLFYSRGKWDFLDIVRMFESILSGSSLLRHSRLHDNGTREDTGNQTQDWTQKVSLRSRTEQREQRDCLTDIYRLFENVTENPWALQFLDSWGKPGPSLLMGRIRFVGNYKQCRSAMAPPLPDEPGSGFKGNYCVLNIAVKGVSGHVGLIGNLELGSCMPDSCTESEITDIVQEKLKTFNLSSELSAGSTECRTDKREVTGATAASILLLTVILILMVSGTLLDIVVLQCPKWNSQCQDQDRAEPGGENNFKPHIKYCQISMETDLSEEEQTEKEDSLAGSVRSRVEKTVIERRASLLTKRVHFKTPWRGK